MNGYNLFSSTSLSYKSADSLASSIFGNIDAENSLFSCSDQYSKVTEKRKLKNEDALNANDRLVKKPSVETLKSREDVIAARVKYSESKGSKKLISTVSVPVLKLAPDEEIKHGMLKNVSRRCKSILDTYGVLILDSDSDATLIAPVVMNSMQSQAACIENKICNKLTEKGIVYHVKEKDAKQTIQSCSTDYHLEQEQKHSFKFDEVASRCLGRLDVRYNMSREPFNHKDVVENEILMSVVRSILGADTVLLYAGIILSFPFSSNQPWHQDGHMLFSDDELPDDIHLPAYALNVFIPLMDITHELGPTEFSVGSHRSQASKTSMQHIAGNELSKAKVIGPLLKRGDVLIYDYRTCHRGTQNLSTTETRRMLYLMYARPWFREHINFGKDKLFE